MFNDWKQVYLCEIGEIITGKTPKTSDPENYGNEMMFLTPSDNLDLRYINETKRMLSDKGIAEVSNKVLPKWTVCVSCIGSDLGKVVILKKEAVTNQQFNSIIPNNNVNYLFLYYQMRVLGKKLNYLSKTSTAVPIINKKQFSNEMIELPKMEEQEKIASLLSSLDDKIENNNAIISNLEEQAQAIFKSWFIDFEPFQDGEFVDSELGKIPAGWKVKKLGDLFSFVKGRKPKAIYEEYQSDSVPYILKKYIDGSEISFVNKEDGILLQELNVFMLMDGANSGNIYYGYKGILGSTFSLISTNSLFDEEYLYWYLKIKETEIRNQNTGSAIPHANKDYIQNIKISLPINIKKDEIIKSLRKIRENSISLRKQNQTLAQLRDTLLPKLMSGEIRVGSEELEEVKNQV